MRESHGRRTCLHGIPLDPAENISWSAMAIVIRKRTGAGSPKRPLVITGNDGSERCLPIAANDCRLCAT